MMLTIKVRTEGSLHPDGRGRLRPPSFFRGGGRFGRLLLLARRDRSQPDELSPLSDVLLTWREMRTQPRSAVLTHCGQRRHEMARVWAQSDREWRISIIRAKTAYLGRVGAPTRRWQWATFTP